MIVVFGVFPFTPPPPPSSHPFLSADEAVEQVQSDQYPISGVCGCSYGEGGVSKWFTGGQR